MNFSKIKLIALTPMVALAVSACGGSDAVTRSYSELSAEAAKLGERLETTAGYNAATDDFENATLASELPTTGTASYSGVSGIWVGDTASDLENNMMANEDTPDILSDLNLTADFDNSTVSGRMDNFQASTNDVQVSGNVDFVNGTFVAGQGGEAGMIADLDGDLVVTEAGVTENIGVTGEALGVFVGDSGEGLIGASYGELTTSFGNGVFGGVWGAERN